MSDSQQARGELAEIEARAAAARKIVHGLCEGTHRWTMSVPPQRDHDSDFVLLAPLEDNERLLTAIRHLERENAGLRDRVEQHSQASKDAVTWLKEWSDWWNSDWNDGEQPGFSIGYDEVLTGLEGALAPTQEAGQSNE